MKLFLNNIFKVGICQIQVRPNHKRPNKAKQTESAECC